MAELFGSSSPQAAADPPPRTMWTFFRPQKEPPALPPSQFSLCGRDKRYINLQWEAQTRSRQPRGCWWGGGSISRAQQLCARITPASPSSPQADQLFVQSAAARHRRWEMKSENHPKRRCREPGRSNDLPTFFMQIPSVAGAGGLLQRLDGFACIVRLGSDLLPLPEGARSCPGGAGQCWRPEFGQALGCAPRPALRSPHGVEWSPP